MARLARIEVFAADEVAAVHVMNRVVRRCFLLGDDPVTGKNFDHRKTWIELQLKRLAANFGIDLLGFAILSNHFHLILRSRPDVVAQWSDTEVARRWLMLCPLRRDDEHQPEEPSEMELDTIRNNPEKLAKIRLRLSDIAWWMRLLCQNIAQRANREDKEQGRFFQSRYRAVRLLDEQALLACAAYVDLNPIRAGIATTIERSDFTSAQRRIQAIQQSGRHASLSSSAAVPPKEPQIGQMDNGQPFKQRPASSVADGHLSPVALNERTSQPGPALNSSGLRASDKGFLPISAEQYLLLLDWTARRMVEGKRGRTPPGLEPLFQRLGMTADLWQDLVGQFGKLFYNVAGSPESVDSTFSRVTHQRYHMRTLARKLYAGSAKT